MYHRYNVSGSSGTFDAVASGSKVSGTALSLGSSEKKIQDLSAIAIVDAETNTFTITPQWEVCDTYTGTYLAIMPANAAANVAIATGTSGADASVTKVISAPDGLYGWKYARLSLVAGGTTGTTDDTYSIAYTYRQLHV